jgi:hypothetical protein
VERHATPEDAARRLAVAYLQSWSDSQPATSDTLSRFYAATVRFHGRVLDAKALAREKRAFVRRWPERDYRHRPESIDVACDADGETCSTRSIFDFSAYNPRRGRRSEGSALLELTIAMKGERPVIIAETSKVLSRSRGRTARGGRTDE